MKSQRLNSLLAFAAVVLLAIGPAAAAEPPLVGCYERTYDTAHLSAHKGQLVERATLLIKAAHAEQQAAPSIVATGELKIWVRGHAQSFDSHAACERQGDGLLCGGSLSAAEADTCASKKDGVRDCRIDPSDAGAFAVKDTPKGPLIAIRDRLELVPAPYDSGPFLSLSETNSENNTFLLQKVTGGCK